MNIVVIFAGGVGARMGYKGGPKQFMTAEEKPILVYTLERFQQHEEIDAIYISTVESYIPFVEGLLETFEITKVKGVVPGGSYALESIINGLRAASKVEEKHSIVLVHDGVRPIISNSQISQAISDVEMSGSSVSSLPAFETVSISHDGVTTSEVQNRDKMFILQAPQAFRLGHILEVNEAAYSEGTLPTFVDQANLVTSYGGTVSLTPGIRENIKITTYPDYEYFKYLVETGKYDEIVSK